MRLVSFHLIIKRWSGSIPKTFKVHRSLSTGMDAFLEFERELAKKNKIKGKISDLYNTASSSMHPPNPPQRPQEEDCCGQDCPNCVWYLYQEELLNYEAQTGIQANVPLLNRQTAKNFNNRPRIKLRVSLNKELCLQDETLSYGSIRSLEFDLEKSSCDNSLYNAADNLEIYMPNSKNLVERFANACNLRLDDPVNDYKEHDFNEEKKHQLEENVIHKNTIHSILSSKVDLISVPTRLILGELSQKAVDSSEAELLQKMTLYESDMYRREVFDPRLSIVDIVESYPSIHLEFKEWLKILPPISPRSYTISTSPLSSPNRIGIIVRVVKELRNGVFYNGACSNYLSSLMIGDHVQGSIRKSSFSLPSTPGPIIMIGSGTGIAPYLAFLEELQMDKEKKIAPAILFFGCRHPEGDFLFSKRLKNYVADKTLDQLFVAFSRQLDTHGKIHKKYVQDMLLKESKMLWNLMDHQKCTIYICGSIAMGADVKKAFTHIVMKEGGYGEYTAEEYVRHLQDDNRYICELWS